MHCLHLAACRIQCTLCLAIPNLHSIENTKQKLLMCTMHPPVHREAIINFVDRNKFWNRSLTSSWGDFEAVSSLDHCRSTLSWRSQHQKNGLHMFIGQQLAQTYELAGEQPSHCSLLPTLVWLEEVDTEKYSDGGDCHPPGDGEWRCCHGEDGELDHCHGGDGE